MRQRIINFIVRLLLGKKNSFLGWATVDGKHYAIEVQSEDDFLFPLNDPMYKSLLAEAEATDSCREARDMRPQSCPQPTASL